MSVRFFCSIFENLTEWRLRGFHKKCFESVGGIPKPFSKMVLTLHMSRRWKYYLFKVVFPLLTCTVRAPLWISIEPPYGGSLHGTLSRTLCAPISS